MEKFRKYESFNFDKTKFTGYEKLEDQAKVVGLFNENAEPIEKLTGPGFVIFDQTPLYAMAGGQASDQGTINLNGKAIELIDLRKDLVYGYFIHQIDTKGESIKIGDGVTIKVDAEFRTHATNNHSALHITWQTILNLIDKYVEELGSKLDNQKYQLQFFPDELITEEIAMQACNKLNEKIIPAKIDSNIFHVTQEEAIEKKYFYEFTKISSDELVRMVEFPGIVIEPCSGTHIKNTSEIKKVWFMNYDKNSKRIIIDMTSNEDFAKEFFNEKLVKRVGEIENFIKKGSAKGLVHDWKPFLEKAQKLSQEWNYFSIKAMNQIVIEVGGIVTKFLKEKEKELMQTFNSQELKPTLLNDKYNLFKTNNEMYSNKMLLSKAMKAAVDHPKLVNVFINEFDSGANVILIRNKDLQIDLKAFNESIQKITSFKGGGSDSMIQLTTTEKSDAIKLLDLLK